MTPHDQTLSSIAINLVSDLVNVFVINFSDPKKQSMDDLIKQVYSMLDTTGFFSELEVHKVDNEKLTLLMPVMKSTSASTADIFHAPLYNNNLISNQANVFSLETSTVYLAYVHSISRPVFLIYAIKKSNIQPHLITSMFNAVINMLSNLYNRQPD